MSHYNIADLFRYYPGDFPVFYAICRTMARHVLLCYTIPAFSIIFYPMQDLQEIFLRLQAAKKRQRDIRQMYKDALANTPGFTQLVDDLKAMREKKKQVEQAIREQFSSEMTELEDLKLDIESDNQLISDVALTQYVKGETVEVADEYENQYEPIFSVKFKKIK